MEIIAYTPDGEKYPVICWQDKARAELYVRTKYLSCKVRITWLREIGIVTAIPPRHKLGKTMGLMRIMRPC
jgi:hypothetical protein